MSTPVRIKTLEGGSIPSYESKGAVAFDIRASEETTIPPRELGLIPTGLVIEVPEGYALLLCARSSTPKKKSLLIPHGVGVIDRDYCGPEDEIFIQYYNFSDKPVTVAADERCAQGLLVRVGQAEFSEVDSLAAASRGGFGSTGLK